MIVESVAIFGITLCILAVFVRSDNADYAMATTPLLIVPAANLLGLPIAKPVSYTHLDVYKRQAAGRSEAAGN